MSRRGWIVVGAVIGVWVLVLAVIGVVAVGVLAGGGGAEWDEELVEGQGAQKVVIVDVRGEIHGGESEDGFTGSSSAGARDIISQLQQAEEDPDVAAVILRLNTPGGAVVASDEIYEAVRRLEDVPVVASMGDVAASGGYYIAAGADRIVAHESTMTGSIGVIMVVPNLQGTADKVGLGVSVIKSGALKDAGSPFRPLEPRERELFQGLIDQAYEQFLGAVSEGRGVPAEEIRPIADGRVLSGLQAQEAGLVDELGDLDRAYEVALDLAQLDREASRLVRYTSSPGLESLFSPFGRSPVEEAKREFGIGAGLQYLFLP